MASIPDSRHAKRHYLKSPTLSVAYRTKRVAATPNFLRWRASAEVAHVAEGHRRAGRLLGVHSMTSSARGEPPQPSPSPRYYVEGYPRLRDDD